MKKLMAVVAGLAAVTGLALAGRLWAQPAPAGGQAPQQTRVAFVNIAKVFQDYKKAQFFRKEMEILTEPKKKDRDKLIKAIQEWQEYLKKVGDPKSTQYDARKKDEAENTLRQIQRSIEDLDLEMRKMLSQRNEQQFVQLYKELNDAVQRHAAAHNYQAIFAYAEPTQGDPLSAPNIGRKVQGLEIGGCVGALYVAPGLDISPAIVDTLNRSYTGPDTPNIHPTGLQK